MGLARAKFVHFGDCTGLGHPRTQLHVKYSTRFEDPVHTSNKWNASHRKAKRLFISLF